MSSDLPASRRRPWTLRAKLTAQLVTVVAVVCLILSLVTGVALRPFLIARLDAQLADTFGRVFGPGPGGGGAPPALRCDRAQPSINKPGQSTGTLLARIVGDDVCDAQRLNTAGDPQDLPADQYAVLTALPTDGRPRTRDLGDFGTYRLTAVRDPLSPGNIMITGLPLSTVDDILLTVGIILGCVSLVAIGAAAGGGTLIIRRTLRPLRRMAGTAGRVAELPLDRGEVALSVRVPDSDTDPRTEVGQVGAALNRMLGHIGNALEARHASELRVRRFVADASHELRTPLAAIRGYAELTRRGRDEVPPDVRHAMSRVESESARMTTLVEDLLLLARLDSGRPLETEEVDLSRMVVDVVSDSRMAGPDHQWRLDLPGKPVVVTGDGARLHQVLVNLLANARVHTPPGTTVTVAVRSTVDSAIVTVTDDGPGISPDLLPEVFERFARGDSSRSRAAGSTGLGLSIVAAVVAAHHGTVEVTSVPGRTVFTVALPR